MYKEHPTFQSPPPDATLWRYMDFTKFVSLLDQGSLFFVRSDKLGDSFEGSFSKGNILQRPNLYGEEFQELSKIQAFEKIGSFIKKYRQFLLTSCWHESTHESENMWRVYARENDGIAIKSIFRSFTRCFKCNEDVYVGRVKYINYEKDFIPEGNMLSLFLHKRQSFKHEHEVRAIIMDPAGTNKAYNDMYDVGKYYKVDIHSLIQEVIVAPYAQDWFLNLVISTANRHGLKVPVQKSSLAEIPTWF